ncbi:hypothetical protein BLA6863_01335 [Burkholderia lata]|uniref:Uncharacterized protein n=1 Tax=Burkholderia lata (strain ATCC 17760 / DSM 23089 / LMG 22485 / NCIMB 9086 / R18194 / 383) TaxID=482957 RepID=A0A6P2INQ1_BURL3|nr:hypothetical protein BLA6863_01335 [Burkholderia lata]
MFVDCKINLPKFGVAGFAILISVNAVADERVHPAKCGIGDECTIIVQNSIPEASRLCQNSPVQMSWSRKSSWTLISCSCDCSDQNNKNWFINGDGLVIGMGVGRYFHRSFFASGLNPMIPDIMASHSMCKPADRTMVDRSSFLLLDKRPSHKSDPYCYDVIYISENKKNIDFFEGGRVIRRSDRDYFYEIGDSERGDLISLVGKVFPVWSSARNQAKQKSLAVLVDRAYLYDRPFFQGDGKSYLIKGDRVNVIGSAENGFVKFRYITRKGRIIEKWLKCEDVNSCEMGK